MKEPFCTLLLLRSTIYKFTNLDSHDQYVDQIVILYSLLSLSLVSGGENIVIVLIFDFGKYFGPYKRHKDQFLKKHHFRILRSWELNILEVITKIWYDTFLSGKKNENLKLLANDVILYSCITTINKKK